MSRIYKSARGKAVDIDQVRLANEQTIAIGNMRVNARGDKLGAGGEVSIGRNEVMDQAYAVGTTPGASYSPNDPATFAAREAAQAKSRAEQLFNMSNNTVEPITEAPVDTEEEAPAASATRGSLASAVAKTATVTQQPLPKPNKKPQGPSRI